MLNTQHSLFLADERSRFGALGIIPERVNPPELETVLRVSARGALVGVRPPVGEVPSSSVLPLPLPDCLSVRGPQPAVVEVVPGREDAQHHRVLQVGGHAGQLGGLRLAGSLGGVVVGLGGSSLVTFA